MKTKEKNKLGQYFTPAYVADFMLSLATINEEDAVLEPSSGTGVFLDALMRQGYENVTAVEFDADLIEERHADIVQQGSFVSWNPSQQYNLVIGNPPYIRWKNLEDELKLELAGNELWNQYCNKLCDYSSIFILKAAQMLCEGGELIFITPEYWLNTTHAAATRRYLLANGVLDSIYLFGETPFFEKASVSTVVFKYVKRLDNRLTSVVRCEGRLKWNATLLTALSRREDIPGATYFELPQFQGGESWVLSPSHHVDAFRAYEKQCTPNTTSPQADLFSPTEPTPIQQYARIGDMCHVANGMVSGLDEAFQLPDSLELTPKEGVHAIRVVKAKHLEPYFPVGSVRYLLLPTGAVASEEQLLQQYPNFYACLQPFKERLSARYAYAKPAAYWEWSFLRNYSLIASAKPRLVVPCKERVTNKDYFRFAYVEPGIYSTQDVTALILKDSVPESLYYVLAMLNNSRVFAWLSANGIVKGGIVEFSEKPINSIPIRRINWNSKREVILHDKIVSACKRVVSRDESEELTHLDSLIAELLG